MKVPLLHHLHDLNLSLGIIIIIIDISNYIIQLDNENWTGNKKIDSKSNHPENILTRNNYSILNIQL